MLWAADEAAHKSGVSNRLRRYRLKFRIQAHFAPGTYVDDVLDPKKPVGGKIELFFQLGVISTASIWG